MPIAPKTADIDLAEAMLSPARFATAFSRGKWKPYRHLMVLDATVMQLLFGDEFDVLIVEIPVRHGKSLYLGKWLPAWYLACFPDRTVADSSHGALLAAKWGREARNVIAEHGELLGLSIDPAANASERWEIEEHGGGMWTAGVGGSIIGRGYHLGIVDDPVKNNEEANSQLMRDKAWDWWQGTWLSREEPGVKRIVCMSRWHNDDLVGRLELQPEGLRIRRLTLPAIAEENDPMGRKPGEALCPERYTVTQLENFRKSRGPDNFAAQYQQRPIIAGGEMLDPALVGRYTTEVGGVRLDNGLRFGDGQLRRVTTVDLAMTTKSSADWSVALTFDVTPEGFMLIRDIDRVKATTEEHITWLASVHRRMRPQWMGIEEGLLGSATIQAASRAGLPVRPLKHNNVDKIGRAEGAKSMLKMRRVYAYAQAPWLERFLGEMAEFPKGRYDDQVDTFAYGCDVVLRGLRGKHEKLEALRDPGAEHRDDYGRRTKRRTFHPIIGRL